MLTFEKGGWMQGRLQTVLDLHVPAKVTIDKSGSNTAVIVGIQSDSGLSVELRGFLR